MTVENSVEGATYCQSLLPDISGLTSNDGRIQKILEILGPRLGPEPYRSPEYEMVSPIGEDYRGAFVNLMLSLPQPDGQTLFRTSANLDQISQDAATFRALETIYAGPNRNGIIDQGDGYSFARLNIENIHNSMAVRNRLRIVKAEFGHFLQNRLTEEPTTLIPVLSIAAGSSRALLEVVAGQNERERDRIQLRMTDLSRDALTAGKRLTKELGITGSVEFIRAHFLDFGRYLPDDYIAYFVEIVGLLDYLREDQIVQLLSEVRSHLSDRGMVLYANIAPNDEQDFTHKIVRWPAMQYRLPEDLVRFAEQAGFPSSAIRVIPEPLGIYNVVSAKVEL